ncbi:hypothetical protein CEXT_775361 [Caerostris extrusa]|uniref:Uncharacterized protein n=1 Tax=Caerostris extrusa TaxID=172846 RepID=A0AAV4MJ41_CAEEX|nr:hypothetical protein CEXT_775361 [Caerostris extrusa]
MGSHSGKYCQPHYVRQSVLSAGSAPVMLSKTHQPLFRVIRRYEIRELRFPTRRIEWCCQYRAQITYAEKTLNKCLCVLFDYSSLE